jgi:hypothetical protein
MHLVLHGDARGRVQPVAGVKAGICWWRRWSRRSYIDSMARGELWLRHTLLLLLLSLHCCKLLWRYSRGKLDLLSSRWGDSWGHTDLLLWWRNSRGHPDLLLLLLLLHLSKLFR